MFSYAVYLNTDWWLMLYRWKMYMRSHMIHVDNIGRTFTTTYSCLSHLCKSQWLGCLGWSQSQELRSPQFPCLCLTFFSMSTARSDFSQLSTIDRSRYEFSHCSSFVKSGVYIKHGVQIVMTNLATFFWNHRKVAKQSDEVDGSEGTLGNLDDAISAYKPPWMRPTNLESSSVQPLNVWFVLHDNTSHVGALVSFAA